MPNSNQPKTSSTTLNPTTNNKKLKQDILDEQYVRKSMSLSKIPSTRQESEELRFYKHRISRFRITHTKYIILLFFLGLLQFISICFFAKGFLLTRHVIDDVSNLETVLKPPTFDKAVVLIIDALRYDFVVPVEPKQCLYPWQNKFTALYNTDNSFLFKFMADPPTTTLQRLKGLTTGSLPTFIDAGSNFNGEIITEDNLIKQLYLNDKRVLFTGDDTWDALFNPYLLDKSQFFESLNVWDLQTVDRGVMDFFNEYLFQKQKNDEWDVLIGHMLGVDHVGHKHGPNHYEMSNKLQEMNDFVANRLIPSIDENTVLFIMGDHGMDHTGNHGGDSQDELESTLFIYSPNKIFSSSNNAHNNHRQTVTVDQIDLVPTFAHLLGLPIPFNNLGWPIKEVVDVEVANKQTLDQLYTYQNVSKVISNKDVLTKLTQYYKLSDGINYQKLFLKNCKEKWAKFDLVSVGIGIGILAVSLVLIIVITKLIPSIVVGQMCHEFVPSIFLMCIISIVSLNSIFQILQQPSFLDNWVWCTLFALVIGIVVGCCIPIFDRYNLKWMFVKFAEDLNDYWSRVGAVMITLHALCFTSNSFTIWEDRIVAFLLTTVGFLSLYEFTFAPKRASTNALLSASNPEQQTSRKEMEMTTTDINSADVQSNRLNTYNNKLANISHVDSKIHDNNNNDQITISKSDTLPLGKFARIIGAYHSLIIILATRLASTITVCREEQGLQCKPTFLNANNYSWWCLFLCFLLIWFLPNCIKGYYNVSSSYQAAAPIWIGQFLKSALFLNFVYWGIYWYENNVGPIPFDITVWKFTLSRIIVGLSIIALNIGWAMGPTCIKLDIKNTDLKSPQATILGYSNVYGSQFFLLVINFLICVFLFNKPLAQLSLFLMVNQLLSILEIFDLLKLKENLVGPVALGLVSYQNFFTTGHQATIPSIQWDMGFILTEKVSFPFTHLGLIMNTFGPFILVSISIALLTLWKQPPGVLKPQTLLARIVSNCGMLLIYNTVLCLSSFAWVTHFRRHLMVWKIFCPRFMFACVCLIITQFVIIFITVGFASGRVIRQVNNIFWK
ncbi:mannose-ethanolamine phosphotransferase GPI13 SCDLUD_001354 [Saccharomycodes ludwigii]|uniref:mannose-ethanolamine phosphotransferase GPI13 n=1 Tax=Saccharomycodes ludwigii TaxID=36035 RepID=UPI001E8340C0|nr:hypothetical protein SCDLUD_001354 [Saccharomycodes ludwigii]KAH3901591.1 hypothetical protein SCDLUD_001354 [Saccharomycodes ludwigii]